MPEGTREAGTSGLPLDGVRVIDLTTSYAGPTAAMLLADMGADVIKVETPLGDDTRTWGPPFLEGESTWFLSVNRNKRSICLDLRNDSDRATLFQLLEFADALLVSVNPAKLARLGLDPEDTVERFPGLIFCALSGFGLDGPDAELPGYDLIAQARSGMMSVTGPSADSPQRMSTAVTDVVAGLVAAFTVASALVRQRRTGAGEVIDVSLLEAALLLMSPRIAAYLAGGDEPQPCSATDSVLTPYQTFPPADRPIVVAAGNDPMWRRLCTAVGAEDLLTDRRFATTADRQAAREEITATLGDLLRRESADEWLERLAANGVPAALVQSASEVVKDPQLIARGALVEQDHPVAGPHTVVGAPWRLRSNPTRTPRLAAPMLGEHTDEVLDSISSKAPS
jgi:crotonobetainyl-CoA:carnitine CoA-transferase CaiB-like acyl-CoA transferase